MSDENNDGAADTGQVSVAELLARNGAKVGTQSGGGRRRRGMAGGISVAELTGEIPIVRDETPAEAPDDETDASPETESPQDQPQQAEEPTRDADPERPAPAPEPTRTTPRIDDRRREQQTRPTPAFGAARSARPEPALFSGAPSMAVDRLRASTEERALAPERPATERSAPDRPGTPDQQRSTPAEPEVDADEVTAENDAVTTIVPAVTEDAEAPDTTTATDDPTDDAALATPTDAEPVEDAPVAPSKSRSPVKQWLSLIGQGIVAIVLGALLFKGFERLWDMLPWVALVLAFFVIVGLVAVVRVLRRTDDIVSILLAVVVGGFVTLGPLAFMLSTT